MRPTRLPKPPGCSPTATSGCTPGWCSHTRPDSACFGDPYSYALCPAHDEVRDYATTLAVEAVRDVAVSGVSVEGLGQLGVAHNGLHEKTDGAYGPAAQRILSVCCC